MQIKKILFIILAFILSSKAYAETSSYDYTFVQNDVFSSDFHTRLNANFTRSLTGGINAINSNNVTDASLKEVDMADEINPRIRTYEGASCEFVYSGLLPTTSGSLGTNISSGTAYPRGYRISKSSSTAHTFSASKWTYVDLDINGNFQYSEQTIGGSTPSVASNSIRLARVSTDTATINDVQDLRKLGCAQGPFENIADVTTEASLEDLFQNQQPGKYSDKGILNGLQVSWDTHTTFVVKKGSAYINGKYRTASADITVTKDAADVPASAGSGIDTGTTAASTGYYIYAVADEDNSKRLSVTYSASSSPSGLTNYRLIGRIATDATALFVSSDVNYVKPGRTFQHVYKQDGSLLSINTVVPKDDTTPTSSEGGEIIRASITPMNANHRLRVHAKTVAGGGSTTLATIGFVYRNGETAARAVSGGCSVLGSGNGPLCGPDVVLDEVAGTTSTITYIFRAGPASAGTVYFNGDESPSRVFTGLSNTFIEIEEYER